MRNVCIVVVTLVLLSSAVVVWSEPSMRGYTGLMVVPTADTLDGGDYNVAISSSEAVGWDDRAYIGNVGIQDGLEAGIYWWHPEAGSSETLLNLKHCFQTATPGRASLAVGVSDITDELDTAVYAVASKAIRQPFLGADLQLHGGIGGGWIDDFFFAGELRFSDNVTVMAEHFNDDISVGARLRLWRNFAVDAGYINTEDWSVNLSYNYPLYGSGLLRPVIGE